MISKHSSHLKQELEIALDHFEPNKVLLCYKRRRPSTRQALNPPTHPGQIWNQKDRLQILALTSRSMQLTSPPNYNAPLSQWGSFTASFFFFPSRSFPYSSRSPAKNLGEGWRQSFSSHLGTLTSSKTQASLSMTGRPHVQCENTASQVRRQCAQSMLSK